MTQLCEVNKVHSGLRHRLKEALCVVNDHDGVWHLTVTHGPKN